MICVYFFFFFIKDLIKIKKKARQQDADAAPPRTVRFRMRLLSYGVDPTPPAKVGGSASAV
jgi:hypothetical protein